MIEKKWFPESMRGSDGAKTGVDLLGSQKKIVYSCKLDFCGLAHVLRKFFLLLRTRDITESDRNVV